jgi:hypothetical protein
LDPNLNALVGEIPHATSGGATFEQLTTTNSFSRAAGMQVTTAGGQIAIEDPDNHAVYTYDPPSGGSLGAPTQITPLGGSQDTLTFAFTKNMADLYTADVRSEAFEYSYPAGGTAVSTFTDGDGGGGPYGMAVIPTQYPNSGR